MALRSTYDTGTYGSGFYGIQETTQGAATEAVAFTTTASAVTVVVGAIADAISVTTSSPSSDIIKDASASANVLAVVTAAAVEYAETDGFRDGYGFGTYGSFVYGENYSVEIGQAQVTATFTSTASCQVTRNVAATTDVTFTPSAQGFMSIVGDAATDISFRPQIQYNRVRLFSAADTLSGGVVASARYKWLPASEPTTTWTTANYLERAA